MAKELLIVFVYDCEMCKKEEDDPQDAIVYFYPNWVSRDQRHALCSQLMGVTQFFLNSFSLPHVISLQSGKFAVKKLGRYILCVGTDRNIPDVVLDIRLKTLYKLLRLFHYDIETLSRSLVDEDDNLSDRLTEIFQVYLPILQFATNKFGNIPVFKLPKSASNTFLEAVQILKSFEEISGVMGGVILYQNKVVATQLDFNLTKQLVVSDPYRIKLPVDSVATSFHLPLGVQLISVYVERKEILRLREENSRLKAALDELPGWRKEAEAAVAAKVAQGLKTPKDPLGPSSGLNREVSTIFTVVEEESTEVEVPDVVRDAMRARQLTRIQTATTASYVATPEPVKPVKTTESIREQHPYLPIRYYSLGLPSYLSLQKSEEESPKLRPYSNTICDPECLYFKTDGLPASLSLFQSRLSGHYQNLKSSKKPKPRPKAIALKGDGEKPKMKPKRNFSLPLKTFSDGPEPRRNEGVPLTPLMAKLSLLAQEEAQLQTPTVAPTPSRINPPPLNPLVEPASEATEISATNGDHEEEDHELKRRSSDCDEDLVPSVLYVFGHSNTAVLLLIESEITTDPERIHKLWETSLKYLTSFETKLHQTVDHSNSSSADEGDYSYVVVDPDWGPIQRGGAYQPHQIELLTSLHHSLVQRPEVTDIVLRTDDTTSYGYQCGDTQIYYQQNYVTPGGLPTPADMMGVIALKAKRRLELDHAILLL